MLPNPARRLARLLPPIALAAIGCDPVVDRDNPFDPQAPPGLQARGRIEGHLVLPPDFDVEALSASQILLYGAEDDPPTTAERAPTTAGDRAAQFFAFDGLDPATYRVEATVPGFGFADGRRVQTWTATVERGETRQLAPAQLVDTRPPDPGGLVLADGAAYTRTRQIDYALVDVAPDVRAVQIAGALTAASTGTFALGARPAQLELSPGAGIKTVRVAFLDAAGNRSAEALAAIGYDIERPRPRIEGVEPEAVAAFDAGAIVTVSGADIAADTVARIGPFVLPCASDAGTGCRVGDTAACASGCTVTLPDDLVGFAATWFVTLETPAPVIDGQGVSADFATLDIIAPVPELLVISPRGITLPLDAEGRPAIETVRVDVAARGLTDNAVYRLDRAVGVVVPDSARPDLADETVRWVTVDFEVDELLPSDLRDAALDVANPSPGGGVDSRPFGLNPTRTLCSAVDPCRSNLRGTRALTADGRAVAQAFELPDPVPFDALRVSGDISAVSILDADGRLLARHPAGGTLPLPGGRGVWTAALEEQAGRAPTVTLRRGGRLGTGALVPVGEGPLLDGISGFAVHDLDDDGQPELLTGVDGEPRVAVYRVADGGLTPVADIGAPASTHAIIAADLDGDGASDLVMAGEVIASAAFGRGDGTFDPPIELARGAGIARHRPLVGDIDRDGLPDVLVCIDGALHTRLNRRRRAFALPAPLAGAEELGCHAQLAMLDGDRWLDLVSLDRDDALRVARGRPGGGFVAEPPLDERRTDFAVADIDGDGLPDILSLGDAARQPDEGARQPDDAARQPDGAARQHDEGTRLTRGADGLRRSEAIGTPGIGTLRAMAVGDLDRDGWTDLAFLNEQHLRHCLYRRETPFASCPQTDAPMPAADGPAPADVDAGGGLALADLDGDGTLDVIARQVDQLFIWRDPGRPADGSIELLDLDTGNIVALRALDVDGDGQLDAAGTDQGQAFVWSRGPAFGASRRQPFDALLDRPLGLEGALTHARDLDGDGRVEIVHPVLRQSPDLQEYRLLLAVIGEADDPVEPLGDRISLRPLPGWSTWAVGGLAFGDVDGDGDLDVFAAEHDRVVVMRDDGGVYARGPQVDALGRMPDAAPGEDAAHGRVRALAAGDLNADGRPDVIAGGLFGAQIALADADGGFRPLQQISPDEWLTIEVADLDHDGRLDLVAFESTFDGRSQALVSLLGRGDGTFTEVDRHPLSGWVAPFVDGLLLADLDGDGHLDVATAAGTRVGVGYGRADGTFGSLTTRDVGESLIEASSLDAGDVDGDGALDLLVSGLREAPGALPNGAAIWWTVGRSSRQVLRVPFAPIEVAPGEAADVEVPWAGAFVEHLAVRVGLDGDAQLTLTAPTGEAIALGVGGGRTAYTAETTPALAALIDRSLPDGPWTLTARADRAPTTLTDFAVVAGVRSPGPTCGWVPQIDGDGPPYAVAGDTADADRRFDTRCAPSTLPGRDRIYAFTAPETGTWRFWVNAGFAATLSVREGCDGHRGIERGCAAAGEAAEVSLEAGETVYVVVDAAHSEAAGPFELRIRRL